MAASMSESAIQDQVINFLNAEFGDDKKQISKAKDLYNKINSTKTSLEKQFTLVSSEAPNKVSSALQDAKDVKAKISQISTDQEQLAFEVTEHVSEVDSTVRRLTQMTEQIRELEKYAKYLEWVARIEDLSSDIQSALIINSIERSACQFAEMAELVKNLQGSSCANLISFANETVMFWYKILKEKLALEFEEVLKQMHWPFISSAVPVTALGMPGAELQNKMEDLFTQLLHLQLPVHLSEGSQRSHPSLSSIPDWRPLLLPLQLMLSPLRKRFRYHFYGNKQTNSLEKPEWYFTQTIGWLRDHDGFLRKKIQPLMDKAGLAYMDAKVEFARGLIMLVMEKLVTDIPDLLYDEMLFSHTIDEALTFDTELRTCHGYPSNQPGCLHVLTEHDAFEKWIIIERKFAVEKMDLMLSSATAWQHQYKDEVDELKVPECAESFMTLMLTITERYKHLPYPQHKLRFLELQLELLDDFRIRLLQVMKEESHNPLGKCFCSILNTTNYITEVLREWSDLMFFLQLQFHRLELDSEQGEGEAPLEIDQLEDSKSHSKLSITSSFQSELGSKPEDIDGSKLEQMQGTVFDDIIDLFEHMKKDMMNNILDYVLTDVKARSRPYRKDRWLSLPTEKEMSGIGLSASACEMLLVLKDRLHTVQQLLSKSLFNIYWRRTAEDLNKFIYNQVILSNHFNDGGAAQLQFDMTRNLFPLFGEFTQKPENYFKDVKEGCILLTLNAGSAILLKEVLLTALHGDNKDQAHPTKPRDVLNETGVFKLSPDDAELVLSLRTDLSI